MKTARSIASVRTAGSARTLTESATVYLDGLATTVSSPVQTPPGATTASTNANASTMPGVDNQTATAFVIQDSWAPSARNSALRDSTDRAASRPACATANRTSSAIQRTVACVSQASEVPTATNQLWVN